MLNDEDIINLCNNMIKYITSDNNIETVIGYLLREIKENNLIYINLNESWYYYDTSNKIWLNYDFRKILFNSENLYNFFNEIIINYLHVNNDLTKNNKNEIIRISKRISEALLNRNIDYNKLEKACKIIFSVNENI
tara:strand:+ start:559 stop:966 length:408 start_codon:yes stop_codon:yes gene_type:complete